jgi:predicted nuclease of predicted toxin-antitoxin system
MKFILDAQLPRRLAWELSKLGHEAIHTLDFPNGNRTSDGDIIAVAIRENRVVVTKDNDFVTTFLLRGVPPKLLLITTGNIYNDALSKLLAANMAALESALAKHDFVELSATTLAIHA